jgi:hypothetical protein
MKLVAELSGKKYRMGSVATFAVHLGTICPDVDVVEFFSETELETESERLAKTLAQYAVPYMRSLASYEALLPLLQERVPMLGGYPQMVTAALYLMGRKEEARQFVLAKRAEYGTADEIARESFDRFAIPFLRLLNN